MEFSWDLLFPPPLPGPVSPSRKIAEFFLSFGRSAREGVGSSGTNTLRLLLPCSTPFPLHPCLEGGVLASSNALDFFPCLLGVERGPLEDAGPTTLFTSNVCCRSKMAYLPYCGCISGIGSLTNAEEERGGNLVCNGLEAALSRRNVLVQKGEICSNKFIMKFYC